MPGYDKNKNISVRGFEMGVTECQDIACMVESTWDCAVMKTDLLTVPVHLLLLEIFDASLYSQIRWSCVTVLCCRLTIYALGFLEAGNSC